MGMYRESAKSTGSAEAEGGGFANSGVVKVGGNLVLGLPSRVLRSGYLHEVRELAASSFQGREDELAAMAAFCTAPNPVIPGREDGDAVGRYWRWLAPAWSGKTALMAQFALNPPQGVDVLAFFITARSAGRSDRTAFLAALEGQLREYLNEGEADCTSQGQFLDALERAADQASQAGRRLVLLVDGLDEDTGVVTASSGYSVAALLPRVPPADMRLLIAGRPNPPVPSDVLENHPLHDTRIDRRLAPSPEAQAVRRAAERDLHTLLTGTRLEQDITCLIAASNGGLSAADLADLAGDASSWHIEEVLGGSLGRSFQRRSTQWPTADRGPAPLFSFAHEELQQRTLERLTPNALADYRERVHV
ncbi:hypothetical protein VR45_36910, partial [Streptomyces sp. NRRL S-495]